MKNLWNRSALKSFFRKGQFPSEVHFTYLIDSMVNKLDDGFSKTDVDGLKLSPTGKEESLMSFFSDPINAEPSWQLNMKKEGDLSNLTFESLNQNEQGELVKNSRLVLAGDGKIGIGTVSPKTDLEVNGTLGIHSRVGTFLTGSVPGDGHWNDVFPKPLTGVQAFEIVARIDGPPQRGKYAITHAIALSAFGKGSNRIKQTRAYFGMYWNRIEFRWSGASNTAYNLQVRTRSPYIFHENKIPAKIYFHVTRLWDDAIFKS